jgi:FkbM family methyltransferase|tara:strand:- start:42 stop:704 length:663 start_codon:yes stop_codon:yes gene_type:complete
MIETDQIQQWHILPNDGTLDRALKKSNLTNILDYQKDQLDNALSYCKQFRHGIDIGANYGLMTYNMSKVFKKVSAFEIVPDINKCFKMNTKKFNLKNVDIYDCGIGDKEQTVSLNFNPQSTFSTHVNLNHNSNKVLVKTLDSFNFDNVDFIKIDAEGFEPFIIQGGLKTIEKYLPVILYERKGHESRYGFPKSSVLDILSKYGYNELHYIGSKNALIGVV